MPRIKSAKKRVETTERNRQRNVAYKSSVKTALKKAFGAVEAKEKGEALTTAVNHAYSLVDRAVLKGILHKNAGARYKSRLSRATAKA